MEQSGGLTDLLGCLRLWCDSLVPASALWPEVTAVNALNMEMKHEAVENWMRKSLPVTSPADTRPSCLESGCQN